MRFPPTAEAAGRLPDPSIGLEALTIADAMRAFCDSGLIDLLDRLQPITGDDLARRAHLEARPVALLMRVLAEAGVVSVAPAAPKWVLNGTLVGWKEMIGASHVGPFLDRGRVDSGATTSHETTEVVESIMAPIAARWSSSLARPDASIVEIGVGAAHWTRAVLDREPTMRSTLVDLGPGSDAHRAELTESHSRSSIRIIDGSLHDVELSERVDLVVVSAVCRLLDEPTNQRLFLRLADWIEPDGQLVIADVVAMPGAPTRALTIYELGLAARATSGRVYSLADFTGWLDIAGFGKPMINDTPSGAVAVLVADGPHRTTSTATGTTKQDVTN